MAITNSQPIPGRLRHDFGRYAQLRVQGGSPSADDILNSAVAAFKQNDYDTALNLANDGMSRSILATR